MELCCHADKGPIDILSGFMLWLQYPRYAKGIISFEKEKPVRSDRTVNRIMNTVLGFYEYLATHTAAPLKIVDSVEDAHKIGAPCLKDEKNLPFIQAVDAALDEMRQDGTLVKISSKYFGKDLSE